VSYATNDSFYLFFLGKIKLFWCNHWKKKKKIVLQLATTSLM